MGGSGKGMGGSDDRVQDFSGRGPGFESGIPPIGGHLTLREAMSKPLWQMWESVAQTLVEVEEECSVGWSVEFFFDRTEQGN